MYVYLYFYISYLLTSSAVQDHRANLQGIALKQELIALAREINLFWSSWKRSYRATPGVLLSKFVSDSLLNALFS